MSKKQSGTKLISSNRKAYFRFAIVEKLEAGIALLGYEVKSLRQGKISLEEAMIKEDKGELFLLGAHIAPYKFLTAVDYNPVRARKLLMHRKEIERLAAQAQAKGMTLIPLELYFKDGRAKVTVALTKGKNVEDKRDTIKKRESKIEIARQIGRR